jgi:dUTP pyrophosphatase
MANIFDKIKDNIPMGEEWESFEKILTLPDEQFEMVYPSFKEQLDKIFSSESFQDELLTEVNSIDISNLKEERKDFEIFLKEISDDDSISGHKKEVLLYFFNNVVNRLYDMAENPRKKIRVGIEKINENAKIPEYAHPSDAGCDVFSAETVTIASGETKIVKTGIRVAIPAGYEIQIRPRSGLSAKTGIRVANAPGTIDSMYRGEIGIILHNTSSDTYTIETGDKIAQMIIAQSPMIKWVEEIINMDTDRGTGGFGSTGN